MNLGRCQRYFQKSFRTSTSPSVANTTFVCCFNVDGVADANNPTSFTLPVAMRASPTLTTFSGTATGQVRYQRSGGSTVDGAPSGTIINENIFRIAGSFLGGGSNSDIRCVLFDYTVDAEL